MAIFHNYTPPQTTYTTQTTYYRALAGGTGYAEGDVLVLTEQLNAATLQPTGVKSWYNVDQDAVVATAPAAANVEALDNNRIVVGTEALTVSTAAAAFANIPANANLAEVHVWDANIVATVDGTAPTTTGTGYRQGNGQTFELESRQEITNFKATRLDTTDAKLWVTYFRVFGDNNE